MRRLIAAAGLTVGLLPISTAWSQQPPPLEAEQLTVERELRPGANVFVASQSWDGSGSIYVYSAADLSYKGSIATGLIAQFTATPDGKTIYTASSFPKRIVSGSADTVLQRFDVNTLTGGPEIKISPKFALVTAQTGAVALMPGGRLALVQNATPATSVSVIDLQAGRQVGEVPTPGCWSIIPARSGTRFSTICGDGTLLSISLNASGKVVSQTRSEKLFDPDVDPLFSYAERVKGDLLFVSYKGVLHRVSDKLEKPELVDKFDFVTGLDGGWAPGGYQVLAYSERHDVVFVPMHPDREDGSHKNGSKEIWAVDLGKRSVEYRSPAEGFTHLAIAQSGPLALFATDYHDGKVARFEIDPSARYAAKLTQVHEVSEVGALLAPR